MHTWFSFPIILQVEQIVDGLGSNNLIKAIMMTLMKRGGLTREEVAKKLLCFGVNGVSIFQGGNMCHKAKRMFGHLFQWVSIVWLIGLTLWFNLCLI